MRVAIIHDWLTGMRGGERCLEHFLKLYPEADVYTLLHVRGATSELIDSRVRGTSLLQKLPGAKKYYRMLLPFFPLFSRSLSVEGYDLVVSLSHAVAKNTRLREGQRHLCFCFTPMRYVGDQAPQYFGRLLFLAQPLIRLLRRWDEQGSKRVTGFAAISSLIRERIKSSYGRDSTVVFPPVASEWIRPRNEGVRGEAFLVAGAMVPYKRLELAIQACNELGQKLWIVGDGPDRAKLEKIAGPQVEFFGRLSDPELADRYRRCRALLFPGVEDFGMMPVECLAAGRPVIGRWAGGLQDILGEQVVFADRGEQPPSAVGVVFQDTNVGEVEALKRAIQRFAEIESTLTAASAVKRAELFSVRVFEESWKKFANSFGMA